VRHCEWLLVLIVAINWPGVAFAQTPEVLPRSLVGNCGACHGREGNSKSHLIPRINGQRPHYIVRRLDQLGEMTGRSRSAVSVAHAANIADRLKSQLAQYFADRVPTPAEKPYPSSRGAEIYRHGIPDRKIAPCSTCHGINGEGDGPIPRLAGQHQAYLKIRLDLLTGFILPDGGAMHLAVETVTPAEVDAITSYLAAQ
jgi:cytochrome c553